MADTATFAVGQRWLSDTESDLGLGILMDVSNRQVTLYFPAIDESRRYAMATAPLTRVVFKVGEVATSAEGWQLSVEQVEVADGVCLYLGIREDTQAPAQLLETQLDHRYQLDTPELRLFNNQLDHPKWFDLRSQCLNYRHQHLTSPILGFVGARVDLIPHQLNIASQVGQRFAPRVLLADEVGLGKTIEAGLIIQQQLLTGKAQRVLIIVPDTLVHQWLVEMLRRVNLSFSLFDKERCDALAGEGNPFETEQLVICSLAFLQHNSSHYQQAMAAGWDLMIVDEAHHLAWQPDAPSEQYQLVEQLASKIPGVLLLTATPDQLGHESHFARLRLLDPNRFHDYHQFIEQEKHFGDLAAAIQPLLANDELSDAQQALLLPYLSQPEQLAEQLQTQQGRGALTKELIDRHGTGRLLYRNTRAAISGFPERQLHQYPLPLPDHYNAVPTEQEEINQWLQPETRLHKGAQWWEFDPRVSWFIDFLEQHKGKKVLTICARAETALELSEVLRTKTGIRAGTFHEGMSIVERDRAANFFAQTEDGAQVLICSEIGSEGRNFQFSHHLVMFDLPLVPDLLEQRIGRLDRIGQRETVNIHVPYFADSPQQRLLDWYHKGLNAFEHTCPTGSTVYAEVGEDLQRLLAGQNDDVEFNALVLQTNQLHSDLKSRLEQGRDRLLELNSSGAGQVEGLLEQITDSDESPTLETFMNRLLDSIGILQEEQDEACYHIRPSERMQVALPGLPEEGMTVTYERDTATQLEHVSFLSWDHPLVDTAMDMILTETLGKASVALKQDKSLPVGSYRLDCLFVLSASAEKALQLERFLPATPLSVSIDHKGQAEIPAYEPLQKVDVQTATQLVAALKTMSEKALEQATSIAHQQSSELKQQVLLQMQKALTTELQRLNQLKKVNPLVRDEEIHFIEQQGHGLHQAISEAQTHLEAIRLVVNTH